MIPEIPDGVDWWDPLADNAVRPDIDAVLVNGIRVTRGSRVLLRPSRRADAQDLFFADRVARVTSVHEDVDGEQHVGVVLEDDPAADLHDWYGRYLYFAPDEVEPFSERSTKCEAVGVHGTSSRAGHCRRSGARRAVRAGYPAVPADAAHVCMARFITSQILVAGIGNIFLGDDGFGPEVIRHVEQQPADPRVRLVDYGIRGMHMAYDLLDGCDALVLVDALPSRGSPGTLHVFEADHESLSATAGLDAHAMDPAAVFASLDALGAHRRPRS